MLRIEFRQMYRSNGLIDDFVIYGAPEDYLKFSELVKTAVSSPGVVVLKCDSPIYIEISKDYPADMLFTTLQNESNEYFLTKDWEARNVLRIYGTEAILTELSLFLIDLSGRGEGYSYISEFSEKSEYSNHSPEWRLHVENT